MKYTTRSYVANSYDDKSYGKGHPMYKSPIHCRNKNFNFIQFEGGKHITDVNIQFKDIV